MKTETKKYMEQLCAAALSELGARRNVITGLTNMSERSASKIVKNVTGCVTRGRHCHSSDWFMSESEIAGETLIFLDIHKKQSPELPRASQFLSAYHTYRLLCNAQGAGPRLDVNYAYLALELNTEGELVVKECCKCHGKFLATEKHYHDPDSLNGVCHVCLRREQFFCINCDQPLPKNRKVSLFTTTDKRCGPCNYQHKLALQRKRTSQVTEVTLVSVNTSNINY